MKGARGVMKGARAVLPFETVKIDGYLYSSLDHIEPSSEHNSRQPIDSVYHPIPFGWELAPFEQNIVKELTKHRWGHRDIMMFRDGKWIDIFCNHEGEDGLVYSGNKCRSKFTGSLIMIRTRCTPSVEESPPTLQPLWKKRRFTDFTISCAGEEVPCHRAVLAVASPVFEAAISHNMSEAASAKLEIQGASSASVSAMLEFVYTGKLPTKFQDHLELLVLADRYCLDSLIKECAQLLIQSIMPETVGPITRILKCRKGSPDLKHLYEQLQEIISKDKTLLDALMALA